MFVPKIDPRETMRLNVFWKRNPTGLATTQNHYIKIALPDAIAAIKQFSQALMCACAPDGSSEVQASCVRLKPNSSP
jgi:hypothetical protein